MDTILRISNKILIKTLITLINNKTVVSKGLILIAATYIAQNTIKRVLKPVIKKILVDWFYPESKPGYLSTISSMVMTYIARWHNERKWFEENRKLDDCTGRTYTTMVTASRDMDTCWNAEFIDEVESANSNATTSHLTTDVIEDQVEILGNSEEVQVRILDNSEQAVILDTNVTDERAGVLSTAVNNIEVAVAETVEPTVEMVEESSDSRRRRTRGQLSRDLAYACKNKFPGATNNKATIIAIKRWAHKELTKDKFSNVTEKSKYDVIQKLVLVVLTPTHEDILNATLLNSAEFTDRVQQGQVHLT
jgi:hypothetical protein